MKRSLEEEQRARKDLEKVVRRVLKSMNDPTWDETNLWCSCVLPSEVEFVYVRACLCCVCVWNSRNLRLVVWAREQECRTNWAVMLNRLSHLHPKNIPPTPSKKMKTSTSVCPITSTYIFNLFGHAQPRWKTTSKSCFPCVYNHLTLPVVQKRYFNGVSCHKASVNFNPMTFHNII